MKRTHLTSYFIEKVVDTGIREAEIEESKLSEKEPELKIEDVSLEPETIRSEIEEMRPDIGGLRSLKKSKMLMCNWLKMMSRTLSKYSS